MKRAKPWAFRIWALLYAGGGICMSRDFSSIMARSGYPEGLDARFVYGVSLIASVFLFSLYFVLVASDSARELGGCDGER